MNKLMTTSVILILITIGLSGCVEDKNEEIPDDEKVIPNESEQEEQSEVALIVTNKNEYNLNKTVNFSIKNNMNYSILLLLPYYAVEKLDNNSWVEMKRALYPCEEQCRMGKMASYLTIEPLEIIEYQWDQKETWCIQPWNCSTTISVSVKPGTYRIKCEIEDNGTEFVIYSNEFTIVEKVENISSIGYLVNHSDEFINKTISVKGTVIMGPPICTTMMCPPDVPCCNACSAQLMLYDNTSMIEVSGICGRSGCDWICSPLELHKTYKVTGNWTNDILEIISYELLSS